MISIRYDDDGNIKTVVVGAAQVLEGLYMVVDSLPAPPQILLTDYVVTDGALTLKE